MIILYLFLAIIGVSFAVLNANVVQVNLYFTTLSMPVSLLVVIMLGIGLLLGFFLFLSKYWRLKRDYSRTKNQLKLTEQEIKNLRDIPIKD
jgi:putative membrane protein